MTIPPRKEHIVFRDIDMAARRTMILECLKEGPKTTNEIAAHIDARCYNPDFFRY